MEPRGLPRLLMHLANGLVILFIMLPIAAVVLGSLQPEKTLQGEFAPDHPVRMDARQLHGDPH